MSVAADRLSEVYWISLFRNFPIWMLSLRRAHFFSRFCRKLSGFFLSRCLSRQQVRKSGEEKENAPENFPIFNGDVGKWWFQVELQMIFWTSNTRLLRLFWLTPIRRWANEIFYLSRDFFLFKFQISSWNSSCQNQKWRAFIEHIMPSRRKQTDDYDEILEICLNCN
jgi:hypothetical protein